MRERVLMMLAGAAIALGAVLAHHLITEAHAEAGLWQCYVVDRFPDVQSAASWKGAQAYTLALNSVAAGSTPGTLLATSWMTGAGSFAPMVCVKQ